MQYNKFVIKLAGVNIAVQCQFQSTQKFCGEYVCENTPDFSVMITPEDIRFERMKSASEDEKEGKPVREFSDEYLETLAVYRKIAEIMPDCNTILFHGSVIAVDGEAYLFTAISCTGKSTHTKLWREYFKERAVMVNDDKPLLKIGEQGVVACGTPWDGKHHLSNDIVVPLKVICILHQDIENHIEPVPIKSAYPLIVQQTYRPLQKSGMLKTMYLLDKMMKQVKLYSLGCNMDIEAAVVAYRGMK